MGTDDLFGVDDDPTPEFFVIFSIFRGGETGGAKIYKRIHFIKLKIEKQDSTKHREQMVDNLLSFEKTFRAVIEGKYGEIHETSSFLSII